MRANILLPGHGPLSRRRTSTHYAKLILSSPKGFGFPSGGPGVQWRAAERGTVRIMQPSRAGRSARKGSAP